VQYLHEGSVRRERDRVRVSVRLARHADGTTLWADSFDRQAGDGLSLQSEIAQRIGRELQIQVLAVERHQPAAPEVVEAYLRGRFEPNQPDGISAAARIHFERAIALDPSYSSVYAGLADYYRMRAVNDDEGSEQAWQLAGQYAGQALLLDGESSETHVAIAQIKLMHDWDWPAAREHALRALQLNPSSPEAHAVYARYLRTAGRVAEAVSQVEQALALHPFRADLREQLGIERYFARDYQVNVSFARQVLAGDPNNLDTHAALCHNLRHLRLYEESVAECSKELTFEGHQEWAAAYLDEYRKHGYKAATSFVARKQLKQTLKRPRPDLWELANEYVLAGRQNEAGDAVAGTGDP
jgi:tetratricopeptide (TPR) repeat protein